MAPEGEEGDSLVDGGLLRPATEPHKSPRKINVVPLPPPPMINLNGSSFHFSPRNTRKERERLPFDGLRFLWPAAEFAEHRDCIRPRLVGPQLVAV